MFGLWQTTNRIETRRKENYPMDNPLKITKEFKSPIKAYKKFENFWINIRCTFKYLNPSNNILKLIEYRN